MNLWSRRILKDIVSVKPLEKYQLYLRFEDDVEGVVNISEMVEFTGVFAALENQEYFNMVKANPDWGTIYWDCGADLDPDVLYSTITGQAIPDYQLSRA